ncbi:sporulation membrane protein YtaF [Desulforamulus ruminis]|uniref:Sporulation protein YtaF n=1 Tax=Desulforamulus ruminis (strain ATCC 23193 / DSM 2154 / NCIMB 8452 / DL) TaxID=696281 RepID=F6DSL2_DESRL|nr:sporulation membrane protein YtaF [Desulforamulus ruminis]AEG61102.1 sporulation protein YtaF [Desulforamulus ruminis DSM 2154]
MNILGIILISLALNLDALGVGFSYGIRKIKLPLLSMIFICLISIASLGLSMLAGCAINHYLSAAIAKHMGGGILVFMGAWAIFQYFHSKTLMPVRDIAESHTTTVPDITTLFQLRLFGILIQVLKDPQVADADQSGTISIQESLLLGMALALDSIGAGVAISLLGYNILTMALCVGACQFIFTYCGTLAGAKLSKTSMGRQMALLPGFILVIIGISRFF